MDNARAQKQNVGRAIVTDRYKYSVWRWGRPREQLVDLQDDPGEMVNLATSRRFDATRDALRARLAAWCKATDDRFQAPGHEILSPGARQV